MRNIFASGKGLRKPKLVISTNHALTTNGFYRHRKKYDLINQSTDEVVFTGIMGEVMLYIEDFLISEYNWSLCLQGFFTAPNGDEYLIEKN